MLGFRDIRLGVVSASRCKRCSPTRVNELRETAEVLADIRAVVDGWEGPLGPNLSFTSGEPFDHPDLDEFVVAAVHGGAQRVRLETDCSALASPERARRAVDLGVRHVRFALLGQSAAVHDALLGKTGAFTSTVEGATRFKEAADAAGVQVQVSCRVAVCRHNVQFVPEMVTAATEAGASSVLISVEDAGLDLRAAAPWIGAGCDTGIVNLVWAEVEGVPYGLATGWELHLASNYRAVDGAKPDRCRGCPLDDVCQGAPLGAVTAVMASFRPPEDAARLRECIRRGFAPPQEADEARYA